MKKNKFLLVGISIYIAVTTFSFTQEKPSLEGRTLPWQKQYTTVEDTEEILGIPESFYSHFQYESGTGFTMRTGKNTKIIPYYAKLRYLLHPILFQTLYYVATLGISYIDGEELEMDRLVNEYMKRVNYGMGIGILVGNLEMEFLYGVYNYQIQTYEKDVYHSTRITLIAKYVF